MGSFSLSNLMKHQFACHSSHSLFGMGMKRITMLERRWKERKPKMAPLASRRASKKTRKRVTEGRTPTNASQRYWEDGQCEKGVGVEVRQHHAVGGQHNVEKKATSAEPSPPPGSRRRSWIPRPMNNGFAGVGQDGRTSLVRCVHHIPSKLFELVLRHRSRREERDLRIGSLV
jgi:hypothetical protein